MLPGSAFLWLPGAGGWFSYGVRSASCFLYLRIDWRNHLDGTRITVGQTKRMPTRPHREICRERNRFSVAHAHLDAKGIAQPWILRACSTSIPSLHRDAGVHMDMSD